MWLSFLMSFKSLNGTNTACVHSSAACIYVMSNIKTMMRHYIFMHIFFIVSTIQTSAVSIDSISYRGIKGMSATEEAIVFNCSDSFPCKRLYLENIQLTALSGEEATSSCWEAYGTSRGFIYPPSCVSSGDIIIRHNVISNSTYSQNHEYAFL